MFCLPNIFWNNRQSCIKKTKLTLKLTLLALKNQILRRVSFQDFFLETYSKFAF